MLAAFVGMLIVQSKTEGVKQWTEDQLLKFYRSAPLAEYEDVQQYVSGLKSKDPIVNYVAMDYWAEYGHEVEELLRDGDNRLLSSYSQAGIDLKVDPSIRTKITGEVAAILAEGLDSTDSVLKQKSAEVLCRFGGTYKRFIPMQYGGSAGARGPRDDLQFLGVRTLFLNFSKVKTELVNFAKSEDPTLVSGSLLSFPKDNISEQVTLAKRLLTHENKYMRAIGAICIRQENVLKSYWDLSPMLEDPDSDVRTTAAAILHFEISAKGARAIPVRSWTPAAQAVYIEENLRMLSKDEISYFSNSNYEVVQIAILENLNYLLRVADAKIRALAPESIFRKFMASPSPKVKALAAIGIYRNKAEDADAVLEEALMDKSREAHFIIFRSVPDTPKWNEHALKAFQSGLIDNIPYQLNLIRNGSEVEDTYKSWLSSPIEENRYKAYSHFLGEDLEPLTTMINQIAIDSSPRIAFLAFDRLPNGDPRRLKILRDYEASLKDEKLQKMMLYGLGSKGKSDIEEFLASRVESGPRELRYIARSELRTLRKKSAAPVT